jgi:Zn-dependent protease with chaperone function
MYLPSADPLQARLIYSLLHVTPAMRRLDHIYRTLYFASSFLHLVVRVAFLSLGFSAAFRNFSDRIAQHIHLHSLNFTRRFQSCIYAIFPFLQHWAHSMDKVRSAWAKTPISRWLAGYFGPSQLMSARSAFIYYLLYTLVFSLFWLPLSYYSGYVLPHRYGLSHEVLGQWASDICKDTGVDALLGALFAALIVWGIAVFQKRWAFVFALWSAPIILAGIFLDPVFDQVDNHFTPLPQSSALYAPLHQLASNAGVPHAAILVADKSKQTDETNAYVTGLGSSARIVIWDTTIKRMPGDEVVAIVGHELGHYVEHHVIIGGVLTAGAMFFFLPLVKLCGEAALARFGRRWKIMSLADPAAIPVLIVVVSLITFAATPVTNGISRMIEHRADSYGLAITRNRPAMARAMVDLANQNMDDPYPPSWEVFWLDDHPPFGERIHYALYGRPIQNLSIRH